jgi:hypothetical protein
MPISASSSMAPRSLINPSADGPISTPVIIKPTITGRRKR